jgi:hypothetical protein
MLLLTVPAVPHSARQTWSRMLQTPTFWVALLVLVAMICVKDLAVSAAGRAFSTDPRLWLQEVRGEVPVPLVVCCDPCVTCNCSALQMRAFGLDHHAPGLASDEDSVWQDPQHLVPAGEGAEKADRQVGKHGLGVHTMEMETDEV